jgi:hypothetical protein
MKSLSDFSANELRQVIAIKEQLETLHGQLEALTGETGEIRTEALVPARRTLSPAHRRKLVKILAKARKARWAKAKAAGAVPTPKKRRRVSAAGRAAISAAAKARWAKFREQKAAQA